MLRIFLLDFCSQTRKICSHSDPKKNGFHIYNKSLYTTNLCLSFDPLCLSFNHSFLQPSFSETEKMTYRPNLHKISGQTRKLAARPEKTVLQRKSYESTILDKSVQFTRPWFLQYIEMRNTLKYL